MPFQIVPHCVKPWELGNKSIVSFATDPMGASQRKLTNVIHLISTDLGMKLETVRISSEQDDAR
jgi:hypothetical protein